MKRLILFACALLLVPSLALAEPKTADEWYKEGETQYNLGNFEKAADAFKQGFSLETVDTKKPAYLFNVAQSYRQANRCKDAVFFYKRFISLKDQDTVKPLAAEKRADIQQRIAELEECAKTQDSIRAKPPEDTIHNNDGNGSGSATGSAGSGSAAGSGSGSGSATRVATKGSGDEGDDDEGAERVTKRLPIDHPKVVTARFVAGGSKITAGSLSVPIQPSFALTAGYPIPVKSAKTLLDGGAVLAMTPLSYTNSFTGEKKTASMVEVLANIGGTYVVAPKISVRGDIGLGLLFFGGIQEMGSPFTQASAGTTGTLAMFAVRAAASADYKLTPNLFATVTPLAFSFSPPKSGLRDDIKSLTRIDFMLGIGYRM